MFFNVLIKKVSHDQFNKLKNRITNFDDDDIDLNLAVDLVLSLFEIFSSRASKED